MTRGKWRVEERPSIRMVYPQSTEGRLIGPWAVCVYAKMQWGKVLIRVLTWSSTQSIAEDNARYSRSKRGVAGEIIVRQAPFEIDIVQTPLPADMLEAASYPQPIAELSNV